MRLIGYVDGVEVKFDFYPPNNFKAEIPKQIPKQIDGTYILELHAIDDAGNETSFSNIFILIDFIKMVFKVLEGFHAVEGNKNYGFTELSEEYISKELGVIVTDIKMPLVYSYRELVV